MNTEKIQSIIQKKGGLNTNVININIFGENINQDVTTYITKFIPEKQYLSSGVRVKNLEGIMDEIEPGVYPGGIIFPLGFLVFATSIGGNAICFEINSGHIFWVDRSSFTDDEVAYKDANSNIWNYLPLNYENSIRALIKVNDNMEEFLSDFLCDKYLKLFDDLDS